MGFGSFLGGGAGMSTKRGPGGAITTYDAGKALQGKMAEEQWDWTKKIYEGQQKALKQFGGLSGLYGRYEDAYNSAKAANEQRYNEIVGIADSTPDQRSADIAQAYEGKRSDAIQRMSAVGLGGSTLGIVGAAERGLERDKQAALDRSTQEHAAQRIGVRERRTDAYPDKSMLLALMQQLGQGGGPAGMSTMLQGLNQMPVA